MFRFESPEYIYLLLLVPVLIGYYFWSRYQRRQALKRFGDAHLLATLMPQVSKYRPGVKYWLMTGIFALSCLLLARPQFGAKLEKVKKHGVEVVIALDISNSMLAQDIAPSRLMKAKRLISKIVENLHDDKVGLIVFAGEAYTQLPITSDFVSAKMFLETIDPSMIERQGTALGKAIQLAARSFTPQEGVSRAIVLITDGENHESGAEQAAKQAAELGIKLEILGIGSRDGAPIPMNDGSGDFRKDQDGKVVVTKLNEQMCQDLAKAGQGLYLHVDNSNAAQKRLLKEIDGLAKTDIESKTFTAYNEQFPYIAWIILILLVIELLILEKRNRRFAKIHLFKPRGNSAKAIIALVAVGGLSLLSSPLSAQNMQQGQPMGRGQQQMQNPQQQVQFEIKVKGPDESEHPFDKKTDREVRRLLIKGNRYLKDSLMTEAQTYYMKAADKDPKSGVAKYNLNQALMAGGVQQLKNSVDAQQQAADSKMLREQHAMNYHNMGVMSMAAKNYKQAVECFKQSLRDNSTDEETRYNLALAQKLLKDQQEQQQKQDKDKKNQDQQNKDQQKDDQKDQNKKDQDKKKDDKQKQNQKKDQQEKKQQQQQQGQKPKMSKQNAEQMLQSAMRDEKRIQDKVKKRKAAVSGRPLGKDW